MTRSEQLLHRQMADIRRVLQSGFPYADEAAAALMPHPGYQPRPGGTRARQARFVAAVAAYVDTLPQHLVRYVAAAVAQLPAPERQAVTWVLVAERNAVDLARLERVTPRTIANRVDRGLRQLAIRLFDEHGHPRIPEGA